MDDRRKKLKFRAWRRGFREIDLILGSFADQRLPGLDDADLASFERLLDQPDHDVYAWVTGAAAAPAEHDTPLLAMIQTFRISLGDTLTS